MDIPSNNSTEYFDFLKQAYGHKVKNVNEISLTLMKYILVVFTGTAALFATRSLGSGPSGYLAVASPAFCLLAAALVVWAWTISLKIASLDMLFNYLSIIAHTFEPVVPTKENEPNQTDSAFLSVVGTTIGEKIKRFDTKFFMGYLGRALRKVRWLMWLAFFAYAIAIVTMALATVK